MHYRSLFYLSFLTLILLFACFSCRRFQKPIAQAPTHVRISMEGDPQTLDPRLVRDLPTATVIHMLYEGLMRIDGNGQPQPAIAKHVTISADQKVYTFTLRESQWSNQEPIKAQDFELTWKSLLDPEFPAPNAYQFYSIKGAKAAKEGTLSLDQVGITTADDHTLIVELEQPTPYFLHLVATYFYYPVSSFTRTQKTSEPSNEHALISNGPFKLDSWKQQNELTVIKNPSYWDTEHVHLDKISLIVVDNSTALQLFGQNDLDWAGSPLSTMPTDAIVTLKRKGDLHIQPAAATYWFRLNTQNPPFDHVKIRQAFSLALNRQELVDHVLQGNQIPALEIVPPPLMSNVSLYKDYDFATAQKLFREALEEQKIDRKDLPKITLCYANGERSRKIAQVVQQQWRQVLGVDVHLTSCESKVYYDKLKNHDYQISIGSWFADIWDPITFLDVFKFKDNGTNNTQWENTHYIRYLNLSALTTDPKQREKFLQKAEHILIREMPVIPLFYGTYNYLKRDSLKNVYFSTLGYLDFKEAYFELSQPDPEH